MTYKHKVDMCIKEFNKLYKQIKYDTFRKKVNSIEVQKELKYDSYFLMKNDWRTKYYSGMYENKPSLFIIHLNQIFLFQ